MEVEEPSMFERLKRLAARLAGRLPFFPGPTEDPFAGVRVPRKHGPGGRHSGIALIEPENDELAGAVGHVRQFVQRNGAR
jgi:hypothetical protein